MMELTDSAVRWLNSIAGWLSSAVAVVGVVLALVATFQSLSLRTEDTVSYVQRVEDRFFEQLRNVRAELNRLLDAQPIDRESPEAAPDVSDSIAELSGRVGNLQNEVQLFRDMVLDDPSLLVTLPLLKQELEQDIEVLREADVQMKTDVSRLAESVRDSNDLMRWVIGALITMVVGVLGILAAAVSNRGSAGPILSPPGRAGDSKPPGTRVGSS